MIPMWGRFVRYFMKKADAKTLEAALDKIEEEFMEMDGPAGRNHEVALKLYEIMR